MTMNDPENVRQSIREDRPSAVYQYRSALTGETMYAVFLTSQSDDIYQSPYVDQSSIVCLVWDGYWTEEGKSFMGIPSDWRIGGVIGFGI